MRNHDCTPNSVLEFALTRYKDIETKTTKEISKGKAVIVTLLTGQLISILYSPDWTILQLKEAIQRKTGIDLGEMNTLTQYGKPLGDSLKLINTSIQHLSTLVLSTQTAGG
jgi:hypothetical protein